MAIVLLVAPKHWIMSPQASMWTAGSRISCWPSGWVQNATRKRSRWMWPKLTSWSLRPRRPQAAKSQAPKWKGCRAFRCGRSCRCQLRRAIQPCASPDDAARRRHGKSCSSGASCCEPPRRPSHPHPLEEQASCEAQTVRLPSQTCSGKPWQNASNPWRRLWCAWVCHRLCWTGGPTQPSRLPARWQNKTSSENEKSSDDWCWVFFFIIKFRGNFLLFVLDSFGCANEFQPLRTIHGARNLKT